MNPEIVVRNVIPIISDTKKDSIVILKQEVEMQILFSTFKYVK